MAEETISSLKRHIKELETKIQSQEKEIQSFKNFIYTLQREKEKN